MYFYDLFYMSLAYNEFIRKLLLLYSLPDEDTKRQSFMAFTLSFFNNCSQSMIRRGGAPPGAAASIITGGMGFRPPSSKMESLVFNRK
jgi:hypothetical protein